MLEVDLNQTTKRPFDVPEYCLHLSRVRGCDMFNGHPTDTSRYKTAQTGNLTTRTKKQKEYHLMKVRIYQTRASHSQQ